MEKNPTVAGAGEAPGREFHEVAELFPMLRGRPFEELVVDIKKNGLREPILLDAEGRIVDGRNRYRACLAAGVEPRFVEWQGEGSLPELALSLNLRRRHLNESQRALVAARVAKLMEKEAVKRKSRLVANLQPAQRGKSSAEAAALVNVSPRLISYAIRVLQSGCGELLAAVESGALAVSTASVLAGLPEAEQKKVAAGGAKEAARKVRELRAGKSNAEQTLPASPPPSPGCFGVVGVKAPGPGQGGGYLGIGGFGDCVIAGAATAGPSQGGEPGLLALRDHAGKNSVVLLWVASAGLEEAIDALKTRGFRYLPSAL